MMVDSMINRLLQYSWDHGIGFMLTHEFEPDMQSVAFADRHLIVINMNWWREREVPFIIAHEISHVLNGDNNALYNSDSSTYALKSEHDANVKAVDILLPIYLGEIGEDYSSTNIQPIMDQLCIPFECKDEVIKIARESIWYK